MPPSPPVLRTAFESWRFMAAHPGAVLRTAWLPTAISFGVAAKTAEMGRSLTLNSILAVLGMGFASQVLLIVTMVAWQRLTLFGPGHRKGVSPLRLGRAELMSALHFPLFMVLLVPMLIVPMIGWIATGPALDGGGLAAWLPYIAFGVLIFPGGPLFTRAALMLAAFAAAGRRKLSITATANTVWILSAGNTIRIFLAIMAAGLPVALISAAAKSLDRTGWHPAFTTTADLLHVVLLVAYIMIVGGTLARIFEALGGVEKKKDKTRRKAAR